MLDAIRRSAQSWGIKVVFGIIIVVFLFWGVGAQQGEKASILAYVNDKPISIREYGHAYERAMQNVRRQNPDVTPEQLAQMDFKKQVLNQLINDVVLNEEAARLKLTASTNEIRDQISGLTAFQNENRQFDPALYRRMLATQGLSVGEFEKDMQRQVLMQKLQRYAGLPATASEKEAKDYFDFAGEDVKVEYLTTPIAKFADAVTPTDAEIDAYYKNHQDAFKIPPRIKVEYLLFTAQSLAQTAKISDEAVSTYYENNKSKYEKQEQVRARHILAKVDPKATEADVQKAKEKILEAATRIKNGEKFEDVAKQVSEDSSAANGGDLDWFGRGQMIPAFETAAFGLAVDALSEPLRTEFGWHLIKVTEKKEAGLTPLADVKDEIRDKLAQDQVADRLADTIDSAVELVISGQELGKIAETMNIGKQTSDFFAKEKGVALFGLEAASLENLFLMKQGDLTDTPLTLQNGYMLAKVLDKKPEEIEPLAQVKDKIVAAIKQEKGKQQAEAEATKLLTAIKSSGLPEDSKAQLKTSQAFGRQGFVQEFGYAPELAKAAFMAKPGEWLTKPYQASDGFVIARLKELIPPPVEEWNKDKDRWTDYIGQSKQQEFFQAFVMNLREGAKIEIVNPKVLE
jgi:peptidyl-prolyl cis-trans isomerase D